ncbi:WXG100 family type VII secretion target [Streptomyces sp. NPDC059740]|uniref:WXG100 family type VII secretion target n=1 Tax=Streptomyces sp. NPDC059740 TaxID=3346926 RepID=UPI003658B023
MTTDAGGGDGYYRYTTRFNAHSLDELKGMLDGADPGAVHTVANHWTTLHQNLVGAGGIKEQFQNAVNKVLESWHGDSADRFKEKATEIVKNIDDGAPYAEHTAKTMHEVADTLSKKMGQVTPVDDGWNWSDDVWTFGQIDDDDLNAALATGADTQALLDANRDNLSGHQQKRLEAAVHMQELGTTYVAKAAALKVPGSNRREDRLPDGNGNGDGSNGGGTDIMTPPMGGGGFGGGGSGSLRLPTKGGGSAGGNAKMPTAPKIPTVTTPGISGGTGSVKPGTPTVHTGLDGLGDPGKTTPSIANPPGGGGGGLNIPGGRGNTGGGGGIPNVPGPGLGGSAIKGLGGSGAPKGGISGTGSYKGGTGVPKTGTTGTGSPSATGAGRGSTGRMGMPGMGGMHGAGKGGAGAGGAGGGSPLARQKGGVIANPGAKSGTGTGGSQGGSGLHRSRGGSTPAGSGSAGRRPTGMMGGAHGAHGAKGEGKGHEGERPDYLIEDEETWTPERNIAPPVIE